MTLNLHSFCLHLPSNSITDMCRHARLHVVPETEPRVYPVTHSPSTSFVIAVWLICSLDLDEQLVPISQYVFIEWLCIHKYKMSSSQPYNPSTSEADSRGLWVQGQPGAHHEKLPLPQKTKRKKMEFAGYISNKDDSITEEVVPEGFVLDNVTHL